MHGVAHGEGSSAISCADTRIFHAFWVSGRVQARTKRWTPPGGILEAFSETDGKMGDYIQKSRFWVEGAFWLAPVERLRLGSTRLRPAFLA